MFYKFDMFTNRLSRSSPLAATNPAGLNPASQNLSVEPVYVLESTKVKPVKLEKELRRSHVAAGQAASAGGKPLGIIPSVDGYQRIVDLQNEWLAKTSEHLMVWQKRGVRDVGLYYATLVGCGAGTLLGFYLVYKMAFPKKAE